MFDEFIKKWSEMEATCSPIICRDEAEDGDRRVFNAGYQGDLPEITDEVEGLCMDLFIDNDGTPNYENIFAIRKIGFKVYPTEYDSFGWLMAACEKLDTHSIIYFG